VIAIGAISRLIVAIVGAIDAGEPSLLSCCGQSAALPVASGTKMAFAAAGGARTAGAMKRG
jgi:hypothetical protein